MKQNTKAILFLSCILSVISCNKSESLADKFKGLEQKMLTQQTLSLANDGIYDQVYKLFCQSNRLIVKDEGRKTLFSVSDLSKNTRVKFGKIGQGPSELGDFVNSMTLLPDNRISFFDLNKSILYTIDYLKDSTYTPLKQLELEREKKILQIVPLAHNSYICLGLFDEGRYLLLDEKGAKISYNFNYPKFEGDEKFTNAHKAMAFQGELVRRPDGKRFLFASSSSEIFEIIELSKDKELTKLFDFQGELGEFVPEGDGIKTVSSAIKKESKKTFIDGNCTQQYIYLLYSGKVIGNDIYDAYRTNKIFVFDWKGNAVKSYHLDVEVSQIAISENDETLYAYDRHNEKMLKFELK